MKLLHVVATYLPATRYGGTIVSVHGLCRALAERGHEVHVFTTSVDGSGDSEVPHGQPVDRDGVSVWYFRSPIVRRLYRSAALGAALRASVHHFDIVHTHAVFLWPMWAAARAAERAGVPYVVSPRGMLERDLIDRKNPLLKALWIAGIERHNLERAAAIHVTSERESAEAAALGLRLPQVCVIPNGVEGQPAVGLPSPSIQELVSGPRFALFLGRLNCKKGLDRLVAATARLPKLRLVIAGPDEDGYRGTIEHLARDFSVTSQITFTGEVHGADRATLLERASMLVLPSYSENFGNVVIEAMAAGCPVIVSREVGVAPMVEARGVGTVVDGGPQSLADAMAAFMHDEPRRTEVGQRGRAVAREEYSWPHVAERMEELYAAVRRSEVRP